MNDTDEQREKEMAKVRDKVVEQAKEKEDVRNEEFLDSD